MRKQYYFQHSGKGYCAWDTDRLIDKSKNLEIKKIEISGIKELNEPFWYGDKNDIPTVKSIVDHIKILNNVSLKYPIVLSAENLVMDGFHRISKALLMGISKIKAVKFKKSPIPDYTDVYPDELPSE